MDGLSKGCYIKDSVMRAMPLFLASDGRFLGSNDKNKLQGNSFRLLLQHGFLNISFFIICTCVYSSVKRAVILEVTGVLYR